MFSIWTWVLQWTKASADSGPHTVAVPNCTTLVYFEKKLVELFQHWLNFSCASWNLNLFPSQAKHVLFKHFKNGKLLRQNLTKSKLSKLVYAALLIPSCPSTVSDAEVFDFNLKWYIDVIILLMAWKRISRKIISFKRKLVWVWSVASAPQCPLCQAVKDGSVKWQ